MQDTTQEYNTLLNSTNTTPHHSTMARTTPQYLSASLPLCLSASLPLCLSASPVDPSLPPGAWPGRLRSLRGAGHGRRRALRAVLKRPRKAAAPPARLRPHGLPRRQLWRCGAPCASGRVGWLASSFPCCLPGCLAELDATLPDCLHSHYSKLLAASGRRWKSKTWRTNNLWRRTSGHDAFHMSWRRREVHTEANRKTYRCAAPRHIAARHGTATRMCCRCSTEWCSCVGADTAQVPNVDSAWTSGRKLHPMVLLPAPKPASRLASQLASHLVAGILTCFQPPSQLAHIQLGQRASRSASPPVHQSASTPVRQTTWQPASFAICAGGESASH